MLIKYKTKPTIIVLSPNSANLIKILTQFVYSINIRYFFPSSPVFCAAKYRGGGRRTEGLINSDCDSNKIKSHTLPPIVSRSITGCDKTAQRKRLRCNPPSLYSEKIKKLTLRIRTYIPLSEGYLKLLPCVLRSKIQGRCPQRRRG